jgi:carboxypeptidase family protein/TonB-dependent receptor-like protein
MKRWIRISIFLSLLFGLAEGTAVAQFSSGIEGIVHDTSGAVIAKANVTITDTRLGVSKTVVTGQDGYFRIDGIAASTYTVEVQMAGFQSWRQDGLTLQIAQIRTLGPELKVGAVSTSVEVSAAATSVDLVSPTTGSIISNVTLQDTPLTGQNIFGLASLTPGMTGGGVETSGNDNYTNEYAININASGLRQEQNGYQIDDAYTNTPSRGGGTSISPNPEIVQSVDVRTNDFDAQKGRNGGATVDVYTISGSNQFHGNVDYYFTNNSLTALTHFENTVPAFTRNEFSATMGGPLFKNKLFWFGAYDVLRSSFASAYTSTVETQDFDNWVQTNLPNTVGAQVLKLAPPQHNPTSGLVPVSAYKVSTPGYFAPPAGIPATLNVIGTTNIAYSTPKNGYQWSFRIDDYIGKSDRLYVDVMRTEYDSAQNNARPAMDGGQHNSSDFINGSWAHTFNSHLLNQAGVNLIRPYGSNLGFPTDQIPYINVTNLQGFGTWAPGNFTQSTYGWHDVMTATIKTHTLKFGGDFFNIREVDHQDGAFDRPTYNFNSLLDFVQDEPTSESATHVNLLTHQEAPYDREYRELYMGYFLQDDWKMMPRLTLNLGVRYDTMLNFFSILSPKLTNFLLGSGSTENARIGSGTAILASSNHVLNHNVGGFTPRVGFSWDVFGRGRTAVRGGFGMFEDQPPYLHTTDITSGNLPNYYTPSISVYSGQPTPKFQLCSPSQGWDEPCPVVDTSNVTLNSSGAVLVNGVVQRAGMGGYDPNSKMEQVEEWSLSVQQQLKQNLIVELNYSGSAVHHLEVYDPDINRFAGDLIVNKGTQQRLSPYFGAIAYAFSNGNSSGNYGSLVVARTLSHGLALRGIYTYGKTLDTMSNAQSLDSGAITNQNDNVIETQNLNFQRGRSDFDIHQQFTADGTWMVPNHYSRAVVRNILGGWQFGGKWVGQTGLPFTVYTGAAFNPVYNSSGAVVGNTGGDYNADGTNYDTPNVPSIGRHLSGQSKSQFLNGIFKASAFPVPTLGQEGTLGRNTYDQPGYKNFDFTFDKFFEVPWLFAEKMKIEAKGEVFNLFNRSNLWTVTSDLSSSTFGQSTNQLPPRSFQLHLRASF